MPRHIRRGPGFVSADLRAVACHGGHHSVGEIDLQSPCRHDAATAQPSLVATCSLCVLIQVNSQAKAAPPGCPDCCDAHRVRDGSKTRLRPKAARRFTSNIRHRPQNRIGGYGDDKLADNDARK
jgi:hypothetical protein